MERKDHIIQCLLQLNDDLRAKIINLYADAQMAKERNDESVAIGSQDEKSPEIKLNGGVEKRP